MSSTVFLIENMKDKFKLIHRRKFITIFLFYVLPVALAVWTYVDLKKVLSNGIQAVEPNNEIVQDKHTAYVYMPDEDRIRVDENFKKITDCINDLYRRAYSRDLNNDCIRLEDNCILLKAEDANLIFRISKKQNGKTTNIRVYENNMYYGEFNVSYINNEYAEWLYMPKKYEYRMRFIEFYERNIYETQDSENEQL